MNILNKNRQQEYLQGKIGLINDGTLEQLREVTTIDLLGTRKYYHINKEPSKEPLPNTTYQPMSYFYDVEMPKWVKVVKAERNNWYADKIGEKYEVINENSTLDGVPYYAVNHPENSIGCTHVIYKSDCTPCDPPSEAIQRTPIAWRLNVDIPEWKLSKGMSYPTEVLAYPNGAIPQHILHHIATPIYTTKFTLSNGSEIELSEEDIENIKKL